MDLEKAIEDAEKREQQGAGIQDGSDQDEPKKPRYTIRGADYVFSELPPIDWIVEGLISTASVSVFYGEPGSKKTYAMLSLAVCVAMGKPWLDLPVNQCKVLFVDEEAGEHRLALRLRRAIKGEMGDTETPIQFVSLASFKLDDKDDRDELHSLINATDAGLVIIDALTDIMDGDENSKQDVQPVFTAVRKIAETTGAAIVIIHHSNKAGGYRGSSAIKGALDLMVKIESEADSSWINLKSEKVRDGKGEANVTAVAYWTENDQFYLQRAETTRKKKLPASHKYVLKYLDINGPAPIQDIIGAADVCSPEAARKAIYKLVEMGMIYRTNPDEINKAAVAIYAIYDEFSNYSEDGDDD